VWKGLLVLVLVLVSEIYKSVFWDYKTADESNIVFTSVLGIRILMSDLYAFFET